MRGRLLHRGAAALGLALAFGTSCGWSAAYADSTPVVSGALSSSSSQVPAGSAVTISGSGFSPGASVTVTLHSTPVVLGTFRASPSGFFSATVTIPAGMTPGTHTLEAEGAAAQGGDLVLSETVKIPGSPSTSLPVTGADSLALTVIGGSAVMAGLGTVLAARRRRTA